MKRIMIVLAFASGATAVHAQNLSLGPTAGFGHAWTSSDNGSQDGKFHSSYNIGGKLVYSFVSHWGISADVKFSSEGETVEAVNGNKSVYRANYIRVPLQGIYFFGEYGNKVRPKISVGPSLGFLVGGEYKQYVNGNVANTVKTKDISESFDFGLTGAVGLNVRVAKSTWLNADVAYYHGLTDVVNTADAKNRNIGLNVGILFPLGTAK
ncbi:PorT family protein [Terrimonas sp. NA20]|uniref:PorT family protein n=1 Tax=Terrimonas ginsenosidimutans TaxID=2908004 RepID=A0ABS9L0Y5_9BACT|nr:porin family protein [Terrimonas ginsenosidimutans]MCG2618210.1 PorT family protein [Terrimonas ginsenosidimutans]